MGFEHYHPAINALFFACVIATTLWWCHPVFTAISFLCALAYAIDLGRWRAVLLAVVLIVLVALYDIYFATFWHFGLTVVGYTSIGNSITLESIVFGLEQGFQFAATVLWLFCLLKVFTADKVVYLLGRVSPRLALFAAIVLRVWPLVADRLHRIDLAQSCIGKGIGQGNVLRRMRHGVSELSTLITWFIEHSAQMSASMQSRGSMLRGRTAYSIYRFDNRDRSLVLVMIALLAILGFGYAFDQMSMIYEPLLIFSPLASLSIVFYGAYAVFCLLPLFLQGIGEIGFRRSLAARFEAR